MDTPLVDKVIRDHELKKKRARFAALLFSTGFVLAIGWLTRPLVFSEPDDVQPSVAPTVAPVKEPKVIAPSARKIGPDGLLRPTPKNQTAKPVVPAQLREALKEAQPDNPNFASDYAKFENEMRQLEERLK